MSKMYAVETENLSKLFGSFKAVDDLNLRVPGGSIYGFLGPNGAGKTTTIKMLTGLSKPSSGIIKICGKEVKFGSLKNRLDIGYLPDVPAFYNWMTPAEFLEFCGELFSIEDMILKDRVEYLLDLVGLNGVKKKIGGFSRGMKQRLGIAQALINNPKVIFLDEPTSALDPIGRKDVMDIIAKLAGKVTVFFSTHILADIERVCDRVVILNKGRVQIEDTMENLRKENSRQGVSVELEADSLCDNFVSVLKQQKWVEDVSNGENIDEIRIYVTDIKEAQLNIPRLLSEREIALKRFSTIEPSLEDIFLKVVNG